jgi:hypothetical protein
VGSQISLLHDAAGEIKSRCGILKQGVKSLRFVMQPEVKSMIVAEIFPLRHSAGSKIFPLHFSAGSCDSLCLLQWGVRSYHCKKK